MPRYSEAMKAAWAKKTPEERSERARALAYRRWHIKRHNKKCMASVTLMNDDGSVVEFHDQAYTDAAVAAAAGTPPVDAEATEVDVVMTDGTTKKFVPAA